MSDTTTEPSPAPPVAGAPAYPLPIDAYYDSTHKTYLIRDADDNWMSVDREAIKHRLALRGIRPRHDTKHGEFLSPTDAVVVRIQQERNVTYAGPLAGFPRGPRWINNVKILVTHSPKMIEPAPGEWPLMRTVIDNQFAPHEHSPVDQRPYWHAWVKLSVAALRQCLVTGRVTYGQVLIMVGKKGCGKSMLQHMITFMLGGRAAYPYQFMSGQTPFNRELFANEHQMIEDEQEHKDIKNRVRFGSAIKQIAAKTEHPCYGKNRDGQTLTPFWRCTVSANDEPDHLEVLPPFNDSLSDKIILLHSRKLPMPMPTGTPEEEKIFEDALRSELPAYLHWLEHEFVIPAEIADSRRYGIKAFMHPYVNMLLNDLLPETRLLALMDHVLFTNGSQCWEGSAEDLTRVLFENDGYKAQARSLLSSSGACGRLLGQLSRSTPDRVTEHRTSTVRAWKIVFNKDHSVVHPPPNDIDIIPLPTNDTMTAKTDSAPAS